MFTTTPAENLAAEAEDEAFIPQLVDGGGYTTQIVIFGGVEGSPVSGNILQRTDHDFACKIQKHGGGPGDRLYDKNSALLLENEETVGTVVGVGKEKWTCHPILQNRLQLNVRGLGC